MYMILHVFSVCACRCLLEHGIMHVSAYTSTCTRRVRCRCGVVLQAPACWAKADSRHVVITAMWDNQRVQNMELGPPMYHTYFNGRTYFNGAQRTCVTVDSVLKCFYPVAYLTSLTAWDASLQCLYALLLFQLQRSQTPSML